MKRYHYLALALMLMMSKAALARVTYVRVQWKEGIETSEYVFRYDKNIPRLYDTGRRDVQPAPCVKASKSFISDLEALIEQGDVFNYAPSYEPAEALCGGYVWELEVQTDDGRAVRSSGHSVEPPNSIIRGMELLMRSFMAKGK